MARPRKTELDYFPFDVVFFDDMKLFELNDCFGPLGEVIYLRLLCLIYKSKDGYFLEKDIDTIALIILKSIGTKWGRSKKFVAQVISQLAEFGLIDKPLLRDGIITSAGIQRRYLKATERRQTYIEKYCLLSDEEIEDIRTSCYKNTTETGVNVAETGVNVAETGVNVAIMPQSKSKNKNINNREVFLPPSIEDIRAYCKESKLNVDAQKFMQYYEQLDWKDGNGNKVKSWQAKAISWSNREPNSATAFKTNHSGEIPSPSRCYTNEEINAMFEKIKPEDI